MASTMTKTIGLCMIVKNETPVILRCLRSVRPLLDYVLIEDTGSTDGTQELIRSYLKQESLPGEVYDQPWMDFAANRSSALAKLRQRSEIDYALVMDADDALVLEPGFDAIAFKKTLTSDLYSLSIQLGPIAYSGHSYAAIGCPFATAAFFMNFSSARAHTPVPKLMASALCVTGTARAARTHKSTSGMRRRWSGHSR